jgi:hypothetical protein
MIEAQVICSFLVPDGFSEAEMETWFSHFLTRGDGDGLKDLLFLYETNVIFLSYEDTNAGKVMYVGKPAAEEHDDALN